MAAQEVVTLNTATPQLEAPQAGSTYTFPRAITGTTAFGVAGSSLGAISFSGNTSGTVTVQPAAAAGTWTFTLPTTAGTNTYALLTNGSGVSSWGQIAIGTAVSGLGTGVATALAVNVGTAGAPVVLNGALGTPSSGTLTNATGLPVSTGISGLGTGAATFLATPSSANLAAALTDETGSGAAVFGTSPTIATPAITNPTITNYVETLYAPSANSAFTVDLANGTVQKLTSNANLTVTLPSSVSGKSYVIIIAYGGTHTLTWAGGSTLKWASGTTPTATSVNAKFDIFSFFCDGTNTYGAVIGQNY